MCRAKEKRSFRSARTICFLEEGVTNLRLQKVLYIAQMFYMGRNGAQPLFEADFQAWDYGPVEPDLYYLLRSFGRSPIRDQIFLGQSRSDLYSEGDDEFAFLKEISDTLRDKTTAQLVGITHRDDGAWANNYQAGVEGIIIPKKDILDEYKKTYEEN